MPGSGAGVIRYGTLGGVPVLTVSPNVTPYTTPNTGYGTIGVNDSGGLCHAAAGFKTWKITVIGPGAALPGYSISCYGTSDPAFLSYVYTKGPGSGLPMDVCAVTAVPATSWMLMDAPSQQGGTAIVANPIVTGTSALMVSNQGWYGIRVVVTATNTPTQPITVIVDGEP